MKYKKLTIERLTVFFAERMKACIDFDRAGKDHSHMSSKESIRELLEREMDGLEHKPQPPKDCDHLWEPDSYQRNCYVPYDYISLTCSSCGATKEVMD